MVVVTGTALESNKNFGSITFLWDGVKGLQTRKSNATVGLSTFTGSILPQVALRF